MRTVARRRRSSTLRTTPADGDQADQDGVDIERIVAHRAERRPPGAGGSARRVVARAWASRSSSRPIVTKPSPASTGSSSATREQTEAPAPPAAPMAEA